MQWDWKAWVLVIAATFAYVPALAAKTPAPSSRAVTYRHAGATVHRTYIRSLGPRESLRALRAHGLRGRGTGFADLVGDPESGYGFYPLPVRYRIGARRYRLTHRQPYWHNPVLFAIAADAARYNDWIPANQGYRYGVFNPNDGVGTPFFGGYYSPGGEDNAPSFPFGRPYQD